MVSACCLGGIIIITIIIMIKLWLTSIEHYLNARKTSKYLCISVISFSE